MSSIPCIFFRIQPGLNSNTNALPPLAEVDESQNHPPEPFADTDIYPHNVQYIPDRPDEPEAPVFQEGMELHIGSDAMQAEALAEGDVGDFATELAIDHMLRDAEANEEPADVYMPKSIMEDIHGECSLWHVF